jgi:hypothetical protein
MRKSLVGDIWRYGMKTSTKWIIGIAIGLLCVVALVAFGYLAFNWWSGSDWMMETRAFRTWGDGRDQPWQRMPMHPNWEMPYTRFGGFYPLRMVASGLICLGLLALIVLGVVALARGLIRPSPPTKVPVAPVTPSKACSNCGRLVQDDWSHCPYCGAVIET